jgi:hypothetical protein
VRGTAARTAHRRRRVERGRPARTGGRVDRWIDAGRPDPGLTATPERDSPADTLPAPRLVGPRGAIRRSLCVWGWGQLATADRRGWLLLGLEVVGLGFLALVAAPYIRGTDSGIVFLAGSLFVAAWAAQALHAERRARRRSAPYAPDGRHPSAAVELLWLAPVVVVGATAFWSLTGPATSADDLLAEYVRLWRAGRAAEAAALFAVAPDPSTLGSVWQRQAARLTNESITAAVEAGPDGGIDPRRPWDAVRWEEPPNESATSAPTGGRTAVGVVVRRETVRDTFVGLVPTTSQRLIPVTTLGTIQLRTVELAGPFRGAPPVVVWRIGGLELLGERLGGS